MVNCLASTAYLPSYQLVVNNQCFACAQITAVIEEVYNILYAALLMTATKQANFGNFEIITSN